MWQLSVVNLRDVFFFGNTTIALANLYSSYSNEMKITQFKYQANDFFNGSFSFGLVCCHENW